MSMGTDPGPPVDIESDAEAERAADVLIQALWEGSLGDEHLDDTPRRFVSMLRELTTPCPINWKVFPSEGDEMIVIKDINFVSLCAHHMLPFIGKAHIGYVPNGKIAGLSKFARVVKHYAARLQVQERLTTQVAKYLEEHLEARGVAVILEGEHLCMSIRGVQSPGTITTTSCMRGVFLSHDRLARQEFLDLVK